MEGAQISETYTGSLAVGESDTYTFTATADFSEIGDYIVTAATALDGDDNPANDPLVVTITSTLCQPESNCADFSDGVTEFSLADQDLDVNCGTDPAGYSDDSDIVFNFVLNDNPFEGTLQVGYADSRFALWIDFNDNNEFETSELVASELVASANQDYDFVVDFSTISGVTPGTHRMRLRGEDDDQDGDVLNPCDDSRIWPHK